MAPIKPSIFVNPFTQQARLRIDATEALGWFEPRYTNYDRATPRGATAIDVAGFIAHVRRASNS
ncbi:MAG: hypothetical protein M3R15_22055 [Acidobacteriota bacterium]|nr:hypothetical protein [Acidobacteriota bacterium]